MKNFLSRVHARARENPQSIVFPESEDPRILKACVFLAKENIAIPVLLGNVKRVKRKLKKLNPPPTGIRIVDPHKEKDQEYYAKLMYTIRQKRGKEKIWSMAKCKKLMRDKMYFAVMIVASGDAQGCISGSLSTTGHVMRAALQLIDVQRKGQHVSGAFLMILKNRTLLFADASTTVDPSSEHLAQFAIDTAATAQKFGLKPKVAILSFATHESAEHHLVQKIRRATELARKKSSFIIDGPLQADAALVRDVAKLKCPKSKIRGDANVLIFPDLQSGNIGYKLVQRLAHARAVGAISQGLVKPVNDLSRGCSVNDIVDLAAITVLQARGRKFL